MKTRKYTPCTRGQALDAKFEGKEVEWRYGNSDWGPVSSVTRWDSISAEFRLVEEVEEPKKLPLEDTHTWAASISYDSRLFAIGWGNQKFLNCVLVDIDSRIKAHIAEALKK